jgi:hypothetical protein
LIIPENVEGEIVTGGCDDDMDRIEIEIVGEDAGAGPSLMRTQEEGTVLWRRWGRSMRREDEVAGPPPGRSGQLVGSGCRGGRRP